MGDVAATKQSKEKYLTLRGHLEELRRRLIWSVIAVVITTATAFFFANHIFDFFQSRAPEEVDIVAIQVTEKVVIYIKVCIYAGVAAALPFLIYQLVMFVRPALTRQERRYLYLLLPGVIFFFAAGVIFCYFVFLPPALGFLLEGPWLNDVTPMISIDNYISVVTRFLFAVGLVFEIPILMYFLTKLGIVSPKGLSRFRKFAIVGAFVIAAVVTPTPDPFNQTIVAVPIIVLYEIGILLSKLARRKSPSAVGE